MHRPPTRLAICVHEAGHAIVQLAHGSHPWINSIAVDGLPGGLLGLVDTASIWQPSCLGLAADREVHEAWSAGACRDVVNYLAGPIAELRWRRYDRATIWLVAGQMAQPCLKEPQEEFSDFGRVRRRLECAIPGDDHANYKKAWMEAEEEVAFWWPQITELGRMLAEQDRIGDEDLYATWRRMRDRKSERRGEAAQISVAAP